MAVNFLLIESYDLKTCSFAVLCLRIRQSSALLLVLWEVFAGRMPSWVRGIYASGSSGGRIAARKYPMITVELQ